MKIIHTSDLHLGLNLYGLNMVFSQENIVSILCDAIKKENADCLIIAGDIFDTSVATADAVNLWSRLVTSLCKDMKIKVVVCAGNHDSASRLSSCNALLKSAGLFVSGHLEYDISPVIIGDTAIYSVPFFNPTDAARIYGCEKSTANHVMKAILDKIRSEMDCDKCNIIVSHCFLSGGEVSESDTSARASAAVGGADNISASAFDSFDYAALGHLHKAQTVILNSGTIIRYSGTPNAYSFSESEQKKTLSVFDTESKELKELDIPEIFRLRTLKGSYDELIKSAENDSNRDDYIKIELTDRPHGIAVHAKFKELYPNMLQFSGVTKENISSSGLTENDIAANDIVSLFKTYYNDFFDNEPDDDIMSWVEEARGEIEQNEK